MNIAHWLERAGRARPGLPAIALGGSVVCDYQRLARRAAGLAAGLARYGLKPGEHVAIYAENGPHYLEILFGAWYGGFAVVPINAKLHASEVSWILEHSVARQAFASPEDAAAAAATEPDTLGGTIAIGSADYERLVAHEPGPIVPRAPGDLAWLFYTSGTTGNPKGAMLTHRNLAAMSLAYLTDVDPTGPGDCILHAAPMSHGSGLYALPHVCRMALNVMTESGKFDPEEVFRLIERWPGSSMFAAPTMIRRMVDCPADLDLANIRTIVWGGAPMHVADVIRALDRFGPRLAQIYGQGESPMTISLLSKADVAGREHPDWLRRIGSAGMPASVVEIRIADVEDRALPTGEAGEVLVRGDSVMPGYWGDRAATEAALRGGWLHTGDIGYLGADGYLTLNDRSKDLIISGGSNIYPREVEEVLLTHPKVKEVSVIGRPDEEWGEITVAYVVGEAASEELDRLCLERIARFKRPKDYVFIPALPKNNYGKILKTELRKMDRARTVGADHIRESLP